MSLGRDLPDPLPLTAGRTVIALSAPQREHFMWPSVRVGHTVEVELGEEKQKVRHDVRACSHGR